MKLFKVSKLRKLPRKYEENFKKIWEKLRNSEKKIGERLRKFLENFTLNLGKSGENLWNFKINSENVWK